MAVADRPLPFDTEAEEAVLASLMVDEDAIFKIQSLIRPQDFFREQNRWVFEACVALWERGEAIDQLTVSHELGRQGRLEEMGGPAALSRMIEELPTSVVVEHYARIVQRDATYRQLIGAVGQIAEMAYKGGPELNTVLGRAEDLILALRSGDKLRDFIHIRHLLEQYWETPGVDDIRNRTLISHVRTGFIKLDELLGGLKRKDLVILAARPGVGKTSLAMNIARNAAIGQQGRVAIFSLEMAADQLAQRLLSGESGIDGTRLRLGEQNEAEERRVMHAMGVLADSEIYIDDVGVQRMPEIRAKAHRLHRERPLDLIVIDYLQLVHGSGRIDNRVAEVSDISRSMKELARELDVPVIACSQLSRAPEQRPTHIPMLSDLRESGSIEQDADVVVFIYREDFYVTEDEWQRLHPNQPYPEGIAQIIVAKHRNGPTGTVYLRFRKQITRFDDLEMRIVEPE
ncbi:MAG: replicative DNA helicase [Dehalococcoidia bacterium]